MRACRRYFCVYGVAKFLFLRHIIVNAIFVPNFRHPLSVFIFLINFEYMRKEFIAAVLCLLAITSAVNVAVARPHTVTGSKTYTTINIPVQREFTGVWNNLPFELQIVQASGPASVSVYLPDNMTDLISVVYQGDNLVFGFKYDEIRLRHFDDALITVTLPTLSEVCNVGSGDVFLKGTLNVAPEGFKFVTNGSGNLTANIINAEGTSVMIGTTGSGDIRINQITAKKAELVASGSGSITANVNADTCAALTTGSGDMRLAGKADKADLSSIGSGSINAGRLDAASGAATSTGSGDIVCHIEAAQISSSGSGHVKNR